MVVNLENAPRCRRGFAATLNAKDATALGTLFTADAEFTNIMGMRMHSREGIIAGHAWAFGGPLAGSQVEWPRCGVAYHPRDLQPRYGEPCLMLRRPARSPLLARRVHRVVRCGHGGRRARLACPAELSVQGVGNG